MRDLRRSWVAKVQYPGREPFLFGTMFAETYAEADAAFTVEWSVVSPHPPPPVIAMIPGAMFFVPEASSDA